MHNENDRTTILYYPRPENGDKKLIAALRRIRFDSDRAALPVNAGHAI